MNSSPYLRKLQYEIPYAENSSFARRYKNQDDTITRSVAGQDALSTLGRDVASAESTMLSRYGLAYRQYAVFLTGYPEYLR